jgi:hypothetical protein
MKCLWQHLNFYYQRLKQLMEQFVPSQYNYCKQYYI